MKTFLKAAAMAAVCAAQSTPTTEFDSDAVNNESSGQNVRVSETVDVNVLGSSNDNIFWQIAVQTRYYEDSGVEKVRLRHKLTADIMAEDLI